MTRNGITLFIIMVLTSCGSDPFIQTSQIPFANVDLSLNLDVQPYSELRNEGDYVYLRNEGVRGIILYRGAGDVFKAFEQNCPYMPNDPCANVSVDPTGFFLIDTCCTSTFDFNGFPIDGPAQATMRLYPIYRSGNRLIITTGQ